MTSCFCSCRLLNILCGLLAFGSKCFEMYSYVNTKKKSTCCVLILMSISSCFTCFLDVILDFHVSKAALHRLVL